MGGLRRSMLRYAATRESSSLHAPHMGRSEAPLPSDRNGEESLEEPTENNARAPVEDVPSTRTETMGARATERLRGVEFKYNEQGGSPLQLNSDYSLCKPTKRTRPPKGRSLYPTLSARHTQIASSIASKSERVY